MLDRSCSRVGWQVHILLSSVVSLSLSLSLFLPMNISDHACACQYIWCHGRMDGAAAAAAAAAFKIVDQVNPILFFLPFFPSFFPSFSLSLFLSSPLSFFLHSPPRLAPFNLMPDLHLHRGAFLALICQSTFLNSGNS